MKRLLLSSAALLAMMTGAQAQQTRAQLNGENNGTITPNGKGLITGHVMNGMIGSIIGSVGLQTDANTWTGLNSALGPWTFNGPLTATGPISLPPITINGITCIISGACTITTAATSVAPGTTTVLSGTNGYLLYSNNGVLGQQNPSTTVGSTSFPGAISPAPRTSAARADDTVNPLNYYAVCDGAQHPLSEVFGNNLAAAQAAFTVNGIQLVTLTSTSQDRDTVGFQAATNTGKLINFPHNGKCWIRAQLVIPYTLNGVATNGLGITGDGSGTFLANDIDFTSTTGAASTSPQGNMIWVAGALTGNPTFDQANPINSPIINGFKFRWQGTSLESFVRPIIFINTNSPVASGLDMTGFNIAAYMIEVDASTNFRVSNNYLHDMNMNRSTNGQLSGIVIDDTVPASVKNSTSGVITGNIIPNLTVSSAFRALFGYQTDGITVNHSKDTNSQVIKVTDNLINNAGEPIDFQANGGLIENNQVSIAHNGGIKLIHGGSNVKVHGNQISCGSIWGIALFGASGGAVGPTSNDWVSDNTVRNMDCLSENLGHTSYAFGTAPDVSNQTFPASNDHFINNQADGSGPATTGGHIFPFFASGSGSGNSNQLQYFTPDYTEGVAWSSPNNPTNYPVTQQNGITLLGEVAGAAPIASPAFTGTSSFQGTTTFGSDVFNQATITGAPTSSSPAYNCLGGDANVGCKIVMKGTGALTVSNGDGILLQAVDPGGTGVNFPQLQGSVTNSPVSFNARGTDFDIAAYMNGKGTEGAGNNMFVHTADPTTANIPTGACVDWNNTTAVTLKRVCNLAGTLRSITYP